MISRIPLHERTECFSPAVLAEQRKESPPTCTSHIEQPPLPERPPTPPTAQAITLKPTFPSQLCGNYGHVGTDCPEKMDTTNSFRHCTNCQETRHYRIQCTKPFKQQAWNTLNVFHWDFSFVPHHSSQCNKMKERTSRKYSNRTKHEIRIFDNWSHMPEGRNQPDLNFAQ